MLKAIYPGSFDPVTNGHMDIIKRVSGNVDTLIVGVCGNPNKKSLLSASQRVELLKEVTKEYKNVEVAEISGMLVDSAKSMGVKMVIRGIRDINDFTNEFQRAIVNRQLDSDIETIFVPASPEHITLSSSGVREILAFNGNLDKFVPEAVRIALEKR